jgi:hypothetical protein
MGRRRELSRRRCSPAGEADVWLGGGFPGAHDAALPICYIGL